MIPAVSVVICTHNRAAVIGRTLDRALPEATAAGAELIVVDNGSTDETPRLLEARPRDAGFRVVREPVLGLSQARNRGAAEARGERLVFIDDDISPRPGWLAALLAPFAAAEVACVGGRILLEFPMAPPVWLTPALHPALAAYDLGDEPRRIPTRTADQYPFGGNVAFRRRTFEAHGGFSTALGLRGPAAGLQKEETDLCWRVDRAGGEIRYAPAAVVDHWVFPDRLRPEWFLGRFALAGKSNAIFELRNRGVHRAFGLMRWHYAPKLALRRYRPREPIDADRLVAECFRQEALGYLRGLAIGLSRLHALRRVNGVAGAA